MKLFACERTVSRQILDTAQRDFLKRRERRPVSHSCLDPVPVTPQAWSTEFFTTPLICSDVL